MNKMFLRLFVVVMAFAFISGIYVPPSPAAETIKPVQLKAWMAWSKDPGIPAFSKFVEKVNEKGKNVKLSVKFVGGPEVFPAFEGIESMLKGVFDISYIAAVYMAGVVPESVAINYELNTPWEARARGSFDQMDKFMQRKNIKYLGWTGYPIQFNIFLRQAREKMDLTGLIIRGASQFIGLIEPLGGKVLSIPGGEVYTALERGMVQGVCWPNTGITDYGWQEFLKYIWGPPFYCMDTLFVMNINAWNKLHQDQKAVLDTVMKELEREQAAANANVIDTQRKSLLKLGVKEIKFSPEDDAKFLKLANDAGWEFMLKRAPESAVFKPLMSK